MIPCHARARGAGQNSHVGLISMMEVSSAVGASKNAAFFSSGIDMRPAAPPIQLAKLGYHAIAQEGSY